MKREPCVAYTVSLCSLFKVVVSTNFKRNNVREECKFCWKEQKINRRCNQPAEPLSISGLDIVVSTLAYTTEEQLRVPKSTVRKDLEKRMYRKLHRRLSLTTEIVMGNLQGDYEAREWFKIGISMDRQDWPWSLIPVFTYKDVFFLSPDFFFDNRTVFHKKKYLWEMRERKR